MHEKHGRRIEITLVATLLENHKQDLEICGYFGECSNKIYKGAENEVNNTM